MSKKTAAELHKMLKKHIRDDKVANTKMDALIVSFDSVKQWPWKIIGAIATATIASMVVQWAEHREQIDQVSNATAAATTAATTSETTGKVVEQQLNAMAPGK